MFMNTKSLYHTLLRMSTKYEMKKNTHTLQSPIYLFAPTFACMYESKMKIRI